MKYTLLLTTLLAACQPQPVVTPVQTVTQQEVEALRKSAEETQARYDAAWDAAEESRKRVLQQYKQECIERWGNVAECKRYEGGK